MIGAFHAAFPGFTLLPEGEMIGEGDWVAVRFRFRGTHTGQLMDIPATGRAVEITGIALYTLANGKIVEGTVEEDIFGMMQQLGVIPTPEQATA